MAATAQLNGSSHRGLAPHDEPSEAEVAEIEARKLALRAEVIQAEWPKSKCAGVIWTGKRWTAQAKSRGKVEHLGSFATEEEAVAAVLAFRRDHPKGKPGRKPKDGAETPVATPSKPKLRDLTVATLPAVATPEPEPDHIQGTPKMIAAPVGLAKLKTRLDAAKSIIFHLSDLDSESIRWVVGTVLSAVESDATDRPE